VTSAQFHDAQFQNASMIQLDSVYVYLCVKVRHRVLCFLFVCLASFSSCYCCAMSRLQAYTRPTIVVLQYRVLIMYMYMYIPIGISVEGVLWFNTSRCLHVPGTLPIAQAGAFRTES